MGGTSTSLARPRHRAWSAVRCGCGTAAARFREDASWDVGCSLTKVALARGFDRSFNDGEHGSPGTSGAPCSIPAAPRTEWAGAGSRASRRVRYHFGGSGGPTNSC
jgi:hypothetical protein